MDRKFVSCEIKLVEDGDEKIIKINKEDVDSFKIDLEVKVKPYFRYIENKNILTISFELNDLGCYSIFEKLENKQGGNE